MLKMAQALPASIPATYIDIDLALARVLELTEYDGPDRDAELRDLLELSAGVDAQNPPVRHYRVWYVAAKTKEQELDLQTLSKAEEGVTFTGQVVPIKSWLFQQSAYDESYGLKLPSSLYSADYLLENMYGIDLTPGLIAGFAV